MIMANKYCNLVGTNKIKDEYSKINTGFDKVETDVNAINGRVDNIVNNPDPNKDLELVDLRNSNIYGVFPTAKARSDNTDNLFSSHQADNVNDADGVHGFKTESGTFTPKIVGLTVEGSNTYTKNIGFYIKQGNLVNVSIAISMSAKDAALSGALAVSGLPFPAVFEAEYYAAPSINWGGFLLYAGRTQISGYLGGGGTAIVLQQCGAGLETTLMDQTNLTDTSDLVITLTYRV